MDFPVNPYTLTSNDLEALRGAVSRISDKFLVYYALPSVRGSSIDLEKVFEQVGARSDVEMHPEMKRWGLSSERDSQKGRAFPDSCAPFSFSRLFGYRPYVVTTHNPERILPEVRTGHEVGVLTSLRGVNFGNVDQAYVSFKSGIAALDYGDQDLAHRLGFLFSPSESLEAFSLKSSDGLTHSKKPRYDSSGKLLLYCDNPCCSQPLSNPNLLLESLTGGIYHNGVCMDKDFYFKTLPEGASWDDLKVSRIPIEKARELYENGKLQQSASLL